MEKVAVILCTLGGPKELSEVEPFLFSLFYDRNIISLPNPFRYLLAKIISKKRKKYAQKIYQQMGGGSSILAETKAQERRLTEYLEKYDPSKEYKVFTVMRHSFPLIKDEKENIKRFQPEQIIILPLYPQFSTTTTKSAVDDIIPLFKGTTVKTICCFPSESNFVASHVEEIYSAVKNKKLKNYRILFSAHGLPEKIIEKGDPYQFQIEETVREIMKFFPTSQDYTICYQSKVGPLKWLGPDTVEAIKKAKEDNKQIILVPVAFVSEHSETIVELDIMYKQLANDLKIKDYIRIPTLSVNEKFIQSLGTMSITVANLPNEKGLTVSHKLDRICPKEFCQCRNNYA